MLSPVMFSLFPFNLGFCDPTIERILSGARTRAAKFDGSIHTQGHIGKRKIDYVRDHAFVYGDFYAGKLFHLYAAAANVKQGKQEIPVDLWRDVKSEEKSLGLPVFLAVRDFEYGNVLTQGTVDEDAKNYLSVTRALSPTLINEFLECSLPYRGFNSLVRSLGISTRAADPVEHFWQTVVERKNVQLGYVKRSVFHFRLEGDDPVLGSSIVGYFGNYEFKGARLFACPDPRDKEQLQMAVMAGRLSSPKADIEFEQTFRIQKLTNR